MELTGRYAGYGAVMFSSVALAINFICVPMIVEKMNDLKRQVDQGMEEFKEITDKTWDEMVEFRRAFDGRKSRAAGRPPFPNALPRGNAASQTPEYEYEDYETWPQTEPTKSTGISSTLTTWKDWTTAGWTRAGWDSWTSNIPQPTPTSPFTSSQCPPGPPGAPGLPGSPGQKGVKGADGLKGIDGSTLADLDEEGCVVCPPGPRGPTGPAGPSGSPGEKGWSGVDGTPGSDGWPGPPGPRGFQGNPGISGKEGVKGIPGKPAPGGKGEPGPKGARGPIGRAGPQGPAGKPGYKAGPRGNDGNNGPKGKDGIPGTDGIVGPLGEVGVPGGDAKYCPCPKEIQVLSQSTSRGVNPTVAASETWGGNPPAFQAPGTHRSFRGWWRNN